MVEPEVLEQFEPLLHGARISGGTKGTQSVVVGYALEQQFAAVEFEAEVGTNLKAADAETRGHAVDSPALMII